MKKIFNIGNFIRETKLEFRHVNWLTKKEVIDYTAIVIVFSLALAVFLGFFDFVFNYILVKFVF